MTEDHNAQGPTKDPLFQLSIAFACFLLLTLTCCGGSFVLAGHRSSKFRSDISDVLGGIGLISLVPLTVTFLAVLVRLLFSAIGGWRNR
jgi:hypothetical protein